MNQARIACVCLVLFGCLSGRPAWAQKKSPGGVKIYLLSGGQRQHHGYRDQAFYLAELLENTGRFEVTLGEDAAILETPAIRKYALIIANADRRDPEFKYTKAQQEALLDYVRSGARLCVDPRRRQRRGRLAAGVEGDARRRLLPRRTPDGKVRKGSYVVTIVDKSSPITQGITDFPLKDELYYNLQMLRKSSPWPPSTTTGPPGRSPGPGPSATAGCSTPCSATAISAPARTIPSA